jgi:hypothetical protein
MRLFRTTTSDSKARFDGILDDDIVLKPGSSIALQSLAIEQNESSIDLRGDAAREFTWTIAGGSTTTSGDQLPGKVYNLADQKQLLEGIRNELNTSILYNPTIDAAAFTSATTAGPQQMVLGAEWDCYVEQDGTLRIQWIKGDIGPHEADFLTNQIGTDITSTIVASSEGNDISVWGIKNAVPATNSRLMWLKDYVCPGSGFIECVCNKADVGSGIVDVERNGFYLGFSRTDLSNFELPQGLSTDAILDWVDELMDYGVGLGIDQTTANVTFFAQYIDADGNSKRVAVNQGAIGSGVTPNSHDNPRVRLVISQGKVYFLTNDNNSFFPASLEMSTPLDMPTVEDGATLWPFVVFHTNEDHLEIAELQVSISSMQPGHDPQYIPADGWLRAYWPIVPRVEPTTMSLTFPSNDFAAYLGYSGVSYPAAGTLRTLTFFADADARFGPRISAQNLIVLCESFELDSYDTTVSGRKSILAVAPIERSNIGTAYIPGTDMYVSIKNVDEIPFRNLRFRIVDGDYKPVDLFGTASLVVLIRGPDE